MVFQRFFFLFLLVVMLQFRVGFAMETNTLVAAKEHAKLFGGSYLHEVVMENAVSKVATVLEFGADVNSLDNLGRTPLHSASYSGNVMSGIITALLLARNANFDIRDSFGVTPLEAAIWKGNNHVIPALLDAGASVKCTSEGGRGLFKAVACGQGEVVKFLLDQGEDATIEISEGLLKGYTLLHIAASVDCWDCIKRLVKRGINVDSVSKELGVTPLHCAVSSGKKLAALMLISQGAKISKRVLEGTLLPSHPELGSLDFLRKLPLAPIHLAAGSGDSEMVKILLDAGADVNDGINESFTPLHIGIKSKEVVEILLRFGANVNAGCCFEPLKGVTPLHCAALGDCDEDIVKILLAKGANICLDNNRGETALYHAVAKRNRPVIKILLDEGADANTVPLKGIPLLYLAAMNGDKDIVEMLLEKGVDVNCEIHGKGTGGSVLNVCRPHQEIVRLLIAHGAKNDLSGKIVDQFYRLAEKAGAVVEIMRKYPAVSFFALLPTGAAPLMLAQHFEWDTATMLSCWMVSSLGLCGYYLDGDVREQVGVCGRILMIGLTSLIFNYFDWNEYVKDGLYCLWTFTPEGSNKTKRKKQ